MVFCKKEERKRRRKANISAALFPKPIEINLADVLFIAARNQVVIFKDLVESKHVHYTAFMNGSIINFHKTLEDQDRHISLAEIEFDWQSLMGRTIQEMRRQWQSILQIGRTDDIRWRDLEVEFMPVKLLIELLSPLLKGVRWNVDMEFAKRLESAMACSKLGELTERDLKIGTGEGYLVMSDGFDCVLFDMDKMSKIVERSFELSITKVRLWSFTPKSILGYLKLRLLVLNNSAVRFLRKL